jgi:hypothetical protein
MLRGELRRKGILVEGADDLAPGEVPVEADEDGGEVRL